MTWSFCKGLFYNSGIRGLFFGTFVTLISIIALRYQMIASQVPYFSLIEPSAVLFSLILFFLSGFLWFTAELFVRFLIDGTIRDHQNINDFLEKTKKSLDDDQDWYSIKVGKTDEWNNKNKVGTFACFSLYLLIAMALVIYIAAFVLFVLASYEFVHQITLDALA